MKKSMQQLPKEILLLIEAALKNTADNAHNEGWKQRDKEIKDYYKTAERRLYAYPELILNLEKYDLDIQDVKKESRLQGTARSKSIVYRSVTGGCVVSKAEILEGRIAIIESKRKRDQQEIDEVKFVLSSVDRDPYYMIIEYKYFDCMTEKEIAEKINCDESTVKRNRSRLMHKILVRFYGAEALR